MVGRRRSVGGRTQRGKERMVRWLKRIALLVVALVVFALVAAWMLLRGSLPELDGEAALPGLSTAATVQRDRLGVVTIDAASEADAMRALGYVHAQERRSEEHTSELQSLMRNSYAVFCLTKQKQKTTK